LLATQGSVQIISVAAAALRYLPYSHRLDPFVEFPFAKVSAVFRPKNFQSFPDCFHQAEGIR